MKQCVNSEKKAMKPAEAMEPRKKKQKKSHERADRAGRGAEFTLLRSLRKKCEQSMANMSAQDEKRTTFEGSNQKLMAATYFVLSILHAQLQAFWHGLEDDRDPEADALPEQQKETRIWLRELRSKNTKLGKIPPIIIAALTYIHPRVENVRMWGKSAQRVMIGQLKIEPKAIGNQVKEKERGKGGKKKHPTESQAKDSRIATVLWKCKTKQDWSKTYDDE